MPWRTQTIMEERTRFVREARSSFWSCPDLVDTRSLERERSPHVENETTVCAGVPASNGRIGAGRRTPEELGREFEATSQTIHNWVKQADRDEGLRSDGLTSAEREEVRRLRREVKQLKIEREILNKPQPGSRGRPTRCHRGIRVREHASGHVSGADDGRTERGQRTTARANTGDPCRLG